MGISFSVEGRVGDPDLVVIGHVTKPHGTKGEVYVWPLTDHPESTFVAGASLVLSDEEGRDPDPGFSPLRVRSVRPFRRGFLLHFDGIEDRDRADLLRARYLLRAFSETEPLADGEIFYHQLLGLRVVTAQGVEVGRVREVYGLKPTDLLEVEGLGRAHLIPFTRQVVLGWSVEEGTMVIDPPEGLLEL